MSDILLSNLIGPMQNGDIVEIAPGLKVGLLFETVLIGVAAASFALVNTLPIGAVPVLAQLQIPTGITISATTAVKVGLGRSTATANPSKYALSAALTAGNAGGILNFWASPLSAVESLYIAACDNSGAAAGTIGGAGQSVIARIVYFLPRNIGA